MEYVYSLIFVSYILTESYPYLTIENNDIQRREIGDLFEC